MAKPYASNADERISLAIDMPCRLQYNTKVVFWFAQIWLQVDYFIYTSTLKSLAIRAISLALSSVIYSLIIISITQLVD